MPTTTNSEKVMVPKFVADEGSLARHGGGAQIDFALLTADADGIKTVYGGDFVSRRINDGMIVTRLATQATVTISVTTLVATVTHTAHGYAVGDQVRIEGATPAALNGIQTITAVGGANDYDFDTTAGDGAATGTILSTLRAWGIAISTTDDQLGENKSMVGVYLGGIFYGNLLPVANDADIEEELGNNMLFQTYADSRLV
jgi:hypothetical protein